MKASSLTSALVVRKGGALPSAPTPQAFVRRPANPPTVATLPTRAASASPTVENPRQTPRNAHDNSTAEAAIAFGQRKATATAPVLVETRETSRKADSAAASTLVRAPRSSQGRKGDAGSNCGGTGGGNRCHGGGETVRMTLRMDARDHLRLKLAAAHSGKNMTRLIDEAIDSYLATLGPLVNGGNCACLAAGDPAKGPGPVGGHDAE